MLTSLEEKVAPQHTALIVIDVQNDFFHPDGVFGQLGRDLTRLEPILPRIEELADAARRSGMLVVFTQHFQNARVNSEVQLEQRSRGRSGRGYCVEGTWGADFYLQPCAQDVVVPKYRYNAFHGTALDVILRTAGIRTLVVTGVASNGCVEVTARAAFMHDYYTVVVEDCTSNFDDQLHVAAMANIREASGIVANSHEVIAAVASAAPTTEDEA